MICDTLYMKIIVIIKSITERKTELNCSSTIFEVKRGTGGQWDSIGKEDIFYLRMKLVRQAILIQFNILSLHI